MNAWNPKNNAGAKNKNVNSIGSVTPVTNDVSDAGNTTPKAILLFSLGAAKTIANPANGNPQGMNENLPSKNLPNLIPN